MTARRTSSSRRLSSALLIPIVVCLACAGGALLLPEGDLFDFVRGLTVGALAVVAVATIVGMLSMRRRESWRAQARRLDDLEPLGAARPGTDRDARGESDARGEKGSR